MNLLKNRVAWIMAGAGVVLTFLVTLGKMVEPPVLFFRYLFNAAVFFALGLGATWAWKKFVEPALNATPEPETPKTESGTEAPVKGGSLDLSVSGDDVRPDFLPAASEPVTAASDAPAEHRPKKSGSKDFEIQDEFIIIKDKRLPNDPKLMAEAIKTKLAE